VGRISTRNFLTLFRAAGVDASARGPDVSDDVELVYIADDLRQRSYIYAGAGTNEAAVVGEHALWSVECRNVGGLELNQITMTIPVPAGGTVLRAWTSAIQPVGITGPAPILTALRTTGLQGLPAGPLGVATSGTFPTGSIPATTFQWVDQAGFQAPFFINQGQHFNVAFGVANIAVAMGIRWRELRLFS